MGEGDNVTKLEATVFRFKNSFFTVFFNLTLESDSITPALLHPSLDADAPSDIKGRGSQVAQR